MVRLNQKVKFCRPAPALDYRNLFCKPCNDHFASGPGSSFTYRADKVFLQKNVNPLWLLSASDIFRSLLKNNPLGINKLLAEQPEMPLSSASALVRLSEICIQLKYRYHIAA